MQLNYIFAFVIFTVLTLMNHQNLQRFSIMAQSALANGLKNEVIKLEGSASIKKAESPNELNNIEEGI